MAQIYADRVKETTATTGTGSYSLAGAVTGHQAIVAAIGTGNSSCFCAEDGTGWEVFEGAVTAGTPDILTRTTILASSNAGAAVDWAAGTKNIFLVLPASKITDIESFCSGKIKEFIKNATGTLTIEECSGTIINNYGQTAANTQTLPGAIAGLSASVIISSAGVGAFHLKAGAGDKIYLDGVALDDGDKVSIGTPVVGNSLAFFSFQSGASSYDWMVVSGPSTTATDGGA
ncbi:MAG: hypothetical protein KKF30_07400 [Proteobacteria bacterium]|nr:hypothetical protein [Pseudomonadota bacterium]MBU4470307.1 hypothetical protein [Pseudomonadota bacterium]MCG2752719.1 hypothetical protein [Desulfobacteraceae bacterium]